MEIGKEREFIMKLDVRSKVLELIKVNIDKT